MYRMIRPLFFAMDPEAAHELTIASLKLAQQVPGGTDLMRNVYHFADSRLAMRLWDLDFSNPVGLAAGFDKHANVYRALAALGFGFVEVGTITPVGQAGNPKPRLFRLKEHEAIINRMGFNNHGAEEAAHNLQAYASAGVPIGINIGKNKVTPNEQAADDYERCLEWLYGLGHYFVINVSSPNTPNLRDLQETESLRQLLRRINGKARLLEAAGAKRKPILLKVAPDMADEHMHDLVRAALEEGISGIIATNTTLSREAVAEHPRAGETGGLSGKPLEERSTAWVREIYQEVGGRIPIIGVGGIFSGADAYRKIRAGASLVQVYTGMAYRGPNIARLINRELLQEMERDGIRHVAEAVGLDAR